MELQNEVNPQEVADCPLEDQETPRAALDPEAELVVLNHKRPFKQYTTAEGGGTELTLYYGVKEVSFDETDLFDFAEGLAKHTRFLAGAATTWGKHYEWPRMRALLEQLIEEGVLGPAPQDGSEPVPSRDLARPSPLPPAPSPVPRTWLESEAIARELTGRSLELGYLELVMPAYRIAHITMDAEERQVGEANVFPPALRVEVMTEWRTCPHAGSRYQDHLPMNVTALKSMRMHWKAMMVALLHIREAYLRRFPQARQGWTVGDLHCLSSLVLSIPAYLTMRVPNRVENGHLSPVLSSMYRVVDGVRMVTHDMLFSAYVEPTRPMDGPVTGAEIYLYAERNQTFHSNYGVCAGPPVMIEELLQVLTSGEASENVEGVVLDAGLQVALDDLEPVFDYALYGLQAYSVYSSRWPAMARAYEELFVIIEAWSGRTTDVFQVFKERLQRSVTFVRAMNSQNIEDSREQREQVYADMYARSVGALGTSLQDGALLECIAPVPVGNDAQARDRLRIELAQRLCGITAGNPELEPDCPELEQVVEVLMGHFRQEQAIVRTASKVQQRINELLQRTAPVRALTAADLALHHQVVATSYAPEVLEPIQGRTPNLDDDLEQELRLRVVVSGGCIEIS